MKSILITGATGFLGKHLVKKLMRADPESRLRALCRGASSWDHDPRVEVVHGDITSAEDVQRAAEGASEIYHLAGIVSRDAKDAPLLYRTHIEGTRNVCEVARRHDAAKVAIASTSGVMAVSRDATVHRETGSYKHEVVGEWPYYLSKIFAEKLALDYFERYQLPVTCVNPSLILGPGDDRNSSTRDVALFLRGQIMAIPEGGLNFVDVRDVALALIAAMRQGKPGERYLVGGQNWSFGEFLVALAMVSGRRAPKLRSSVRLSLASAHLLRPLLPLVGKSFELDDASIKMSALFWYCDSSKARTELGFQARDPMETLRDTVEDLRQRQVA